MILSDGKILHGWDSFKDWLFVGGRWVWGACGSLWAFVSPLHTLIICAVIAIGIDFFTGNVAAVFQAKRTGSKYRFNSDKMWKTGWKLALTIIGSGFAWMLDTWVFPFTMGLAPVFASFILGAEFCSFLENASAITGWTGFVNSKKVIKDTIQSKTNVKIDNNETEA